MSRPIFIAPFLILGALACSSGGANQAGSALCDACATPGDDPHAAAPRAPGDSGAGGTTDAHGPAPDAFVKASIQPGTNASACTVAVNTQVLVVGVATAAKPAVVEDGMAQMGAEVVHVACQVTAAGGSFDASLAAALGDDATTGDSIRITGAIDSAGGQDLSVRFVSQGAVWTDDHCAVAYTYDGSPVPATPAVAAGRVWGHVSCPNLTANGAGAICDGEADFLFENCTQ